MKYIMIVWSICCLQQYCVAQSAVDPVTARISQKMKDTLALDLQQYRKVDSINQFLYQRKQELRVQYADMDSLTAYTQLVEKSRDSLYKMVLPLEVYHLYRTKKRNLISNK